MKIHNILLMACVLGVSAQVAAASSKGSGVSEASGDVISAEFADGFIPVREFSRFTDTGKLAVCLERDGRCEEKQWLTPQQAISKSYPKAVYVGFKVLRRGQSELDVLLFYRSKP